MEREKKVVVNKITREISILTDHNETDFIDNPDYFMVDAEAETIEGHKAVYSAKNYYLRAYNEMIKNQGLIGKHTKLYTPLDAEYSVTIPFVLDGKNRVFTVNTFAKSMLDAYTNVFCDLKAQYEDIDLSPYPKNNVIFKVFKNLSEEDICNMLQLIKYDPNKVVDGKFYPKINCLFSKTYLLELDRLFVMGYVSKELFPTTKEWYYRLTAEGFKYLESELGILIAREDE